MKTTYFCYFCEKQNVKLWRPCQRYEPLICAECAEKRQPSKGEKWSIDDTGKRPARMSHQKTPVMTNQLFVQISDTLHMTMVPAVPHETGGFWSSSAIPEELRKWWEELPIR